ncbi:MAG: beta-galactosidase [Suipraeoptans sp.]
MNIKKPPFVYFGGDYNPDQWDYETLKRDIVMLKEAGITLLTLPVFSWAKLEPGEGVYDFKWLDDILYTLSDNGMKFCLATPTTAQPAWLSAQYPEVLPVDISGRKRTHGMRVFFCVNSTKFRERAAAIADEMGKRYHDLPGLSMWHVGNEYGTYCYCDNCQKKFRIWLANRYGSINELNNRWHTSFWGRTVYDFDEIMLPTQLNDDYRFNPAIELDYRRFMTDSTKECFLNEADVLRKYTPDIPVFSNISGQLHRLDQRILTENMDYAAWDNYPAPTDEPGFVAMKHDLMRSLKNGRSYFVSEQSPNQQNWQPYNKLKRPGELRTIAFQGIAHCADSCLYFQMRQSIAGQEKFHGALISHADRDDTRIFKEMSEIGADLKLLGDRVIDAVPDSTVGLLFDWDNWWALELASGPTKDMNYLEQVYKYYKMFYEKNVSIDILGFDSDFSNYKILVLPLVYMLKPGLSDKITEFTENGGTIIGTYMTGIADENDRCVFGAYPGPLRDVFGLWVEETDAMYPNEHNHILLGASLAWFRDRYECGFLCDLIHTNGAKTLAVYCDDFYKDLPCVTMNHFGKGFAYYLATEPSECFLNSFVEMILDNCKITPIFNASNSVEITKRINKYGSTFFVINHLDSYGFVDLKHGKYTNILNNQELEGHISLKPKEVLVLVKNN